MNIRLQHFSLSCKTLSLFTEFLDNIFKMAALFVRNIKKRPNLSPFWGPWDWVCEGWQVLVVISAKLRLWHTWPLQLSTSGTACLIKQPVMNLTPESVTQFTVNCDQIVFHWDFASLYNPSVTKPLTTQVLLCIHTNYSSYQLYIISYRTSPHNALVCWHICLTTNILQTYDIFRQ